MCGIAGFIVRKEQARAIHLTRSLDVMAARGPDGQGEFSQDTGAWSVGLGHRRLSIIDLTDGAQPMSTPDGRFHLTFNGEIYNYRALGSQLESKGHQFRTKSDTEVVLTLLAKEGPDSLSKLDGIFALGLWDTTQQTLILARDRAGTKPLYYGKLPEGGIAFASVLDAIPKTAEAFSLNPRALQSYFLLNYIPSPLTIYSNVFKLEAGCWLKWKGGEMHPSQKFWKIADQQLSLLSRESLEDRLWQTLDHAVEKSLVSDVPVGVLLSGGLDSSVVSQLASERLGRGMFTFSIGFKDKSFDESAYALELAKGLKSEHTQKIYSDSELIDEINPALSCLDEPLADPSLLPTFLVSRIAAQKVKVVLSGDGSDELWGGYPTYRANRISKLFSFMPATWIQRMAQPMVKLVPSRDTYMSFEWKLKTFVRGLDSNARKQHLKWLSSLPEQEAFQTVKQGGTQDLLDFWLNIVPNPKLDDGNRLLALDFSTYLTSILTKVDRASMGNGLEVRPPFLTNDLIDFAYSVPAKFKHDFRSGKILLKAAARGKIPSSIIDRPKHGFAIPISRWMRGPLSQRMRAIFNASPVWETAQLDRNIFKNWWKEHTERKCDRSRTLWALLVLDHWLGRSLRSG